MLRLITLILASLALSSPAWAGTGFTITDLGTLRGADSYARDINNNGQVVGNALTVGEYHAFLYSEGSLFDLNTLLPSESGWLLGAAYGINDLGQIVGWGTINGHDHAFLMTPSGEPLSSVPVPSAVWLLGSGLAGLLGLGRGRRRGH